MATRKQILANRRNAAHSTGPRTPDGKAVSSQNALKSGIDAQSHIIRGEDPETLAALAAQYYADLQPQSADESALVDILVDNEWTLRRLRKIEARLWENQFSSVEENHNRFHPHSPLSGDYLLGKAYQHLNEVLARLERRRELAQRAYHRALQDFGDLQAAHPQWFGPPDQPSDPPSQPPNPPDPPQPSPEPLPEPPPTHSSQKPNPTIGFVPQNLPTPLPDPHSPAQTRYPSPNIQRSGLSRPGPKIFSIRAINLT